MQRRDRDSATRREREHALRTWLLAESAYAGGHLADEVLTLVQDAATDVLGAPGVLAVGEHLTATGRRGADAAARTAGDPASVEELLAVAAHTWRPGSPAPRPVEHGRLVWAATPPGPVRPATGTAPDVPAEVPPAPAELVVRAAWTGTGVWDGPGAPSRARAVDVTALGASAALAAELDAWNGLLGGPDGPEAGWADPAARAAWGTRGWELARRLHREVGHLPVTYHAQGPMAVEPDPAT
ncbi:hypothetical protein [Kineococcus arenarius]|uniref:hypothetical protein n=1 Tax=unclassified Kineococcus TaxID=2621656 RepID=UPI003D7D2B9B